MENRFVYMDNAATTRILPQVLETMMPYLTEEYGNPSSIYRFGRDAQRAVMKARAQVADAIGANEDEIYFTSGGTESDNWAIKGTAAKWLSKGKANLITSSIEHHAVLHSAQNSGFEVTTLPVDENGLIHPVELEKAISPKTAMVSIMFANNEIGTVQPIQEIAEICKKNGVIFHTDAVQAIGNIEINVHELGVDMLSLSAHKIHGPKGVGALYCRKGCLPVNFMDGGAQENAHRAGTENTAGIIGLGKAIEMATADIPGKIERLLPMREHLIHEILKISHTRLNGDKAKRLCGNVNVSFEGIEGESLLLSLDHAGICASSGSACTSGSLDPSHVLLAIGLTHDVAHGSLRLTLSEGTTQEEVLYVLEKLPPIVSRLRSMSPLWEKICDEEK